MVATNAETARRRVRRAVSWAKQLKASGEQLPTLPAPVFVVVVTNVCRHDILLLTGALLPAATGTAHATGTAAAHHGVSSAHLVTGTHRRTRNTRQVGDGLHGAVAGTSHGPHGSRCSAEPAAQAHAAAAAAGGYRESTGRGQACAAERASQASTLLRTTHELAEHGLKPPHEGLRLQSHAGQRVGLSHGAQRLHGGLRGLGHAAHHR